MGAKHRYVIAFGSNRRHGTIGSPRKVLGAASVALHRAGIQTVRASRLIHTAPLGPSLRRYANAALLIETPLGPEELLELLKNAEHEFGRRSGGQRWTSRVLDLDIVLWSGGAYASDRLTIPHPRFRERPFVLGPANDVAPRWRDPLTGLTVRQLKARLTARRPLSR
ncbi:MAG: 2-amino-4-hydroxy-6-hydroxymethyldihydropteridine diphosphokinase [Candidatus Andeanibacterium colombiense]|uniref:2-amino-4-hydroxy-6-hydroxymethyldihydropteridine pyrophosphokinase n=1 Tax=Candidatus Andeanibacterium colombiense TaxID=3121345 RepID=A0AAJ5X753_9SPHN|nr:MAG: 2-amino-4-hydroxy-6-hydroxymethyldihydropteridine diphosphokinase [Sphingomonadaceae bacterium]